MSVALKEAFHVWVGNLPFLCREVAAWRNEWEDM